MKSKLLLIIFLFVFMFSITGCSSNDSTSNESALKFKEEYESLNGVVNSSGKEHRSVTISEDNPFVYVDAEQIVEMIDNEESFYVYFGSKLCPWCRSVIEEAISVASENNIKTIYYVEIWDDEGTEILRDKYTLEDGALTLVNEGTESYYKLLNIFDTVLGDYSLTDDDGNSISVGEKRIYAPTFIYVKNGVPVTSVDGISDKQSDSREELTDEILEDENKQFTDLFSNK